jgi:hypothetical protein
MQEHYDIGIERLASTVLTDANFTHGEKSWHFKYDG